MRAGTILPILLHEDCMALLPCLQNDVRLEVYPDSNGSAKGDLYRDDGSSYDYSTSRDALTAWHLFNFDGSSFTSNFAWGNTYLKVPNVATVVFYGITAQPTSIINDNSDSLPFIYESSTETLYVQINKGTPSFNVNFVINY